MLDLDTTTPEATSLADFAAMDGNPRSAKKKADRANARILSQTDNHNAEPWVNVVWEGHEEVSSEFRDAMALVDGSTLGLISLSKILYASYWSHVNGVEDGPNLTPTDMERLGAAMMILGERINLTMEDVRGMRSFSDSGEPTAPKGVVARIPNRLKGQPMDRPIIIPQESVEESVNELFYVNDILQTAAERWNEADGPSNILYGAIALCKRARERLNVY